MMIYLDGPFLLLSHNFGDSYRVEGCYVSYDLAMEAAKYHEFEEVDVPFLITRLASYNGFVDQFIVDPLTKIVRFDRPNEDDEDQNDVDFGAPVPDEIPLAPVQRVVGEQLNHVVFDELRDIEAFVAEPGRINWLNPNEWRW